MKRRDMKRSKDRRVTRLGGNPSGLLILFKYLKVRSYSGFFPGKNGKVFVCKRNYFVLQSETATFACWRKRNVECINVIKWAMFNVNYFVFQLCLINSKSVLISWTYVLVWMFFSTFMMSFPLWVMKFLTDWWAILSCMFLFMFFCLVIRTVIYDLP